MLWVDKHRPKALNKLIIHQDIGNHLIKLVETGDCPHTLFYGPTGAGKKTLIMGLLRQIYGTPVERLKVETKPWKIELPSRNLELELTTVSSNYHVEINPSDAGNNDRYIVQEIIKEIARSRPVDTNSKKGFKVLVLSEVDRMSKEAQHSLRRTMEKYSAACRLVLCCNNASRVIEPVRSRCLCVRVGAPSALEIVEVLHVVAKKENLALPEELASRIAASSGRDLRRALLAFEVARVQQYPFSDNQAISLADWELYIQEIVSDCLKEQTPKMLFVVRGKLYELLINCIPPEIIFKRMLTEFLRKTDDCLRHKVVSSAAKFEHRLQQGSKPIFHLEAFLARVMSEYKQWSMSFM